jgi:outer membrane lipoprotein-sorting protein
MTTKELIDKVNKSTLKDVLVCQRSGDETINGVSTTLYTVEDQTPSRASHSRIWISKPNGLPLKTEVRLGGGDVMTSLFDYDHVEVPPGAR